MNEIINDLSRAADLRPFRPFVIHLSSGANLAVAAAHRIAISPSGERIHVFTEDSECHSVPTQQIVDVIEAI